MTNLFPTIVYSGMIGMTILALLEVFQRPNERQNVFLKSLIFLLLVHLAGELFITSGAYVYAPALAGAQFPLRILLGPALYFYAHASMSPDKTIDKRLKALVWSGPILVVLVMLPFIFAITPAEKLALADPSTRNPELWRVAVLTCFSATFIFISFTALFLFAASNLHNSHVQQLKERFSEIEEQSLRWFRTALILWGVIWLLYAVEFSLGVLGWFWFGSGVFIPILEAIALMIFIQKALNQKILNESEKGFPCSSPTRTTILSAKKTQLIASKLDIAMRQDKVFLQQDLSLNKLSELINETENHISETFSQCLNTNFFQFVNEFRVEEAKKALHDKGKLITNIAFDVGFNSKSTFNTAFKKIVGCSPSAYRKLCPDN